MATVRRLACCLSVYAMLIERHHADFATFRKTLSLSLSHTHTHTHLTTFSPSPSVVGWICKKQCRWWNSMHLRLVLLLITLSHCRNVLQILFYLKSCFVKRFKDLNNSVSKLNHKINQLTVNIESTF